MGQWFTTARQVLRKQYGTVQAGGQERAIWRLLHASCHWQQSHGGTPAAKADAGAPPMRLA
jgi:hypothetical protein